MKPRSIAALNSLADPEFFEQIATGLSLVADHCQRFEAAAALLASQSHGRAARAIEVVAGEEAAKYLILVDAVRCPRHPPARRAEQLRRFNLHLPRGIYAECVGMKPVDFGELSRHVDLLRRQYYLDGPNDVDWVFRNEIMQRREEALYVDYVMTDEGHQWIGPHPAHDATPTLLYTTPRVVRLVRAFHDSGFGCAAALEVVADVWRPFTPLPTSHRTELASLIQVALAGLKTKNSLTGVRADHQEILESWPFPLWSLGLTELEVDIEELRERQQSWSPDW